MSETKSKGAKNHSYCTLMSVLNLYWMHQLEGINSSAELNTTNRLNFVSRRLAWTLKATLLSQCAE